MMCRPLSHTHAHTHRRHAQPQAAQVKLTRQCLRQSLLMPNISNPDIFCNAYINENVNGCLPIDAEA